MYLNGNHVIVNEVSLVSLMAEKGINVSPLLNTNAISQVPSGFQVAQFRLSTWAVKTTNFVFGYL
jgi:hypothetical protein